MAGSGKKSIAVFYDCCIPRPDFESILFKKAPFAEHIFVQDICPPKICNSDPHLFWRVWLLAQVEYKDKACFLVSIDRRFVKKVESRLREERFARRFSAFIKTHEGDIKSVPVVRLGHCGSTELNRRRAEELSQYLSEVHTALAAKKRTA